MKKTPLHSTHVNTHKAKMAPFAGYDMPLQYTSAKEEIAAVRTHAGIFDVSHMGEFFVSGPDTESFINFVITNDFKKLPIGKAIYSPICNDEGGIIDDLIVYKTDKYAALICVNAANIKNDWNWISSKASSFDIQLTNSSDDYSLIALQGPKSEEILKQVFSTLSDEISEMPYYGVIKATESQIIARTGYTGEDGFEVFVKNDFANNLWSKLIELNATPCGLASRDTLRLEVCYPLYGHELSIENTPKESALSWTMKKDNENYLGKNSIESREPTSMLVKLSLEKLIPREGYKVFIGEQEIGSVTSGTFSPTISQGIAIARVKKVKNIKEEDLLIEVRGKKYPATFHTKAFYAGGIKK